MNEQIRQAAAYIESLEQRIAALETRLTAAEQQHTVSQTQIGVLTQRLTVVENQLSDANTLLSELQSRPATVTTTNTETTEPEVEVELIVADEPQEEPIAQPTEEIVDEPQENPIQPAQTEDEPQEQPIEEQVEQIVEEPVAEPHRPVQTTLFGSPVQDIRQAISLGDRFLFQRELFGGKGEQMQKTLDAINQLSSLEEAETYIGKHFSWNKESSTTELFMNVLHRRFS